MLLSLLSLLSGPALAGTVVVHTTIACEVRLDHMPVVHTFGPATVSLPEVEAGRKTFTVYRGGDPAHIEIEVPSIGSVRLLIGSDELSTDVPESPPAVSDNEAGPPMLELRADAGQRFSVILDGRRTALLGPTQALRFEGLNAGEHTLQLRSPDNLTVWVRGQVTLQAGQTLTLNVSEGRMVEAFGDTQGWRATGF